MECPYCDVEMNSMGGENICPNCRLAISITFEMPQTPQTKLSFFLKSLSLLNTLSPHRFL